MATAVRVDPRNAEQARAWDGDEGAYWAQNAERYDAAVAGYQERLLDAAEIDAGSRVLDVGCGTGQTTRDAARRASAGSAVGIDLSARMLDVARRTAAREGVANVEFVHGDAAVHPFPAGSFDVVLSRTGVMFFGDPVAAFTHLAQAVRPGGRLALLVWQPAERNAWFRAFSTALAAGRTLPVPPVGAPGPFSLGDPDRVRALLTAAGFGVPRLAGVTVPMRFGWDADEAYGFVLGQLGWLLEGLDAAGRARALDALRATVEAHSTDQGVQYDSAAWLVTGVRPGRQP